jgi:hypothetical protein
MDRADREEKKRLERIKTPPGKGASKQEIDKYEWDVNKPKRDAESLDTARKMIREGLEGEKDIFSRVSPVMRKQATEHYKEGMGRYTDPDLRSVREKQAYDEAGYKKGGSVTTASKRADGCATKGKTRGRVV